jgi:hypothetical protein
VIGGPGAPNIDMCNGNMRQENDRDDEDRQRINTKTSPGHERSKEAMFSIFPDVPLNRKQVHDSAVHKENYNSQPSQQGYLKETNVQVTGKQT